MALNRKLVYAFVLEWQTKKTYVDKGKHKAENEKERPKREGS